MRGLWDGRVYFQLRATDRDLLVHYRLERRAPTFEIDLRLVSVQPLSGRVGQQRFLLALFGTTACATFGLLIALLAPFRPHVRDPREQQDTRTRDLYFRSLIMVYSAVRPTRLRDRWHRAILQMLNAPCTSMHAIRQLLYAIWQSVIRPKLKLKLPPPAQSPTRQSTTTTTTTSTSRSSASEPLLARLRAVNRFPLLVSDERDLTRPRERRRAPPTTRTGPAHSSYRRSTYAAESPGPNDQSGAERVSDGQQVHELREGLEVDEDAARVLSASDSVNEPDH